MAEQYSGPICTFDGDNPLAADADRFIQTMLAEPRMMEQAFRGIRVTSNGEFLYGVPSERNTEIDAKLTLCISAVATVLDSGADRYFRYDKGTRQAMEQSPGLKDLWGQKRDAQEENEGNVAARLRIARLTAFAGRVADPYGMNKQLPASPRQQRLAA